MRAPNFDFVGRRHVWWLISGILILVSVISLVTRQLNLSIDFVGGSSFTVSGIGVAVSDEELESAAEQAGASDVQAQLVEEGGRVTGAIIQTAAIPPGSEMETAVAASLRSTADAGNVEVSFVGPTWGARISQKMLQALVVFLIAVVAYISVRLEFKMSVAALIALAHDIILTSGVYSVFGFKVSPETVIAFLTVLGYSLYDTVVVFDRVQETTGRLGSAGRRTYSEAVNTSMNEVFWRSVNTSAMAVLPVLALLVIGSRVLGATTLEDLAIALFVGMVSGVYSSLFIAGPFLAIWREREPKMIALARKAERRAAPEEQAAPAVPVPAVPSSTAEQARGGGEEPRRPSERVSGLEPHGYVRGPGRKPRSKRR
ncbi:MAG: protein translocase subunit SecF, partial [Actinomycetota bacterium]|nr:protein translocase subunit SecF [Actinomycetota bacterium]